MRILHTSDWHLGKLLDGHSRIEEQEAFIEELIHIADEKCIDMVIIAGDIYDTGNPPSRAERLFYSALKRLSKAGTRAIVVIAGNHDNPDRLSAAAPLASEHGIMLLGTPATILEPGRYGNFDIEDSGEGYIEIDINGERSVIITIPYPSEKRLNEVLSIELDEEARQLGYSDRIGELFDALSKKYRADTVNLAVSHLFMTGGEESRDSERPIQLGGSFALGGDALPKGAQYIALGHLHKPQQVKGCTEKGVKAYYSGSPIQYSKSELNYSKCIYIVDVKAETEASVEEVYLKNYKPIEIWRHGSIEEALQRCKDDGERNIWVYMEIKTDRVLTQAEIKDMRSLRPGIIDIQISVDEVKTDIDEYREGEEKGIAEFFEEFYGAQRQGILPSDEVKELFLSILGEDDCEEEKAGGSVWNEA